MERSVPTSDPTGKLKEVLQSDKVQTTYKYSLAAAVIGYCLDKEIKEVDIRDGYVYLPLGSIVKKWIEYYLPIFNNEKFISISQIENSPNPSRFSVLREPFSDINGYYKFSGNHSSLIEDLKRNALPREAYQLTIGLFEKIINVIIEQPMKHFGRNITNFDNGVFSFSNCISKKEYVIPYENNMGVFDLMGEYRIPVEWYHIFSGNEGKDVIDSGFLHDLWLECLIKFNSNTGISEEELNNIIPQELSKKSDVINKKDINSGNNSVQNIPKINYIDMPIDEFIGLIKDNEEWGKRIAKRIYLSLKDIGVTADIANIIANISTYGPLRLYEFSILDEDVNKEKIKNNLYSMLSNGYIDKKVTINDSKQKELYYYITKPSLSIEKTYDTYLKLMKRIADASSEINITIEKNAKYLQNLTCSEVIEDAIFSYLVSKMGTIGLSHKKSTIILYLSSHKEIYDSEIMLLFSKSTDFSKINAKIQSLCGTGILSVITNNEGRNRYQLNVPIADIISRFTQDKVKKINTEFNDYKILIQYLLDNPRYFKKNISKFSNCYSNTSKREKYEDNTMNSVSVYEEAEIVNGILVKGIGDNFIKTSTIYLSSTCMELFNNDNTERELKARFESGVYTISLSKSQAKRGIAYNKMILSLSKPLMNEISKKIGDNRSCQLMMKKSFGDCPYVIKLLYG